MFYCSLTDCLLPLCEFQLVAQDMVLLTTQLLDKPSCLSAHPPAPLPTVATP